MPDTATLTPPVTDSVETPPAKGGDPTKRAVLELRHVSKTYGHGRTQQEVTHDMNLTVREGEFLIIMGPSGSGKTTALNLLSGLETPTEGKVVSNGSDLYALSDDERAHFRATEFGIIYQQPHWIGALNVVQNVALPLVCTGMAPKLADERALEALRKLDLQDLAASHPNELSGGEQQRVGIARAMVHEPLLIIADEPTGNLDTHTADTIMSLFSVLNYKEKKTLVLVTHNPLYLPYATHFVEIRDGAIVNEEWGSNITWK
jgi:putative ABC transport system ATP-binding protein